MSFVTNIVLTVDYDGREELSEINEWLLQNGGSHLVRVDEFAGGTKAVENDVWAGAFNYLDEARFIDKVRSIRWESPAVLVMQTEAGPFHVFALLNECLYEGADGPPGAANRQLDEPRSER